MGNELIIYKPKKNLHKIILKILLGLFISILIFVISVFSSAIISCKSKWDKSTNVDFKSTVIGF